MRWNDRSTTNGFLICDFHSKIRPQILKTKILAVLGLFLQKMADFFTEWPLYDTMFKLTSLYEQYMTFIEKWRPNQKTLDIWLFLAYFLQKNGWFFYWMIPLWYDFQTNVFVCTIYDFYWELKTIVENIRYFAPCCLFFAKNG